jgi:IS5 family transposase
MHKRKKPWKQMVKRTRSLLSLLDKLIRLQEKIDDQNRIRITYPEKYYSKKRVIHKVLSQQQEMFWTKTSLSGRIVSISKAYVRPSVRGKEVNRVEFGAKVNMIEVNGINFIEHLDFDPFNESTHLRNSVWYARTLFGRIIHISADDIYATNANRQYCR